MDAKQIHRLTAFLSLSRKNFNKWADLSWQMRFSYLSGKSTEIAPCMYGDFWHNNIHYLCNESGIRPLDK